MNDYDVYYRAGHSAFEFLMGRPVSFGLIHGESSPFRYPPFMAWVFMPFAWLPLDLGRGVWVAIGWCAYLASLMRLEKAFTLSGYALGSCRRDHSIRGRQFQHRAISTILGWLAGEGFARGTFTNELEALRWPLGQASTTVFIWDMGSPTRASALVCLSCIPSRPDGPVATFGTEAFVTWLY